MYSSLILNQSYKHFDPFNILNTESLEDNMQIGTGPMCMERIELLDHIDDSLDITCFPIDEFNNHYMSSILDYRQPIDNHCFSIIINDENQKLVHQDSTVPYKITNKGRNPQIVDFLLNLLNCPNTNPSIIRWENHKDGKFKFVDPEKVSKLWGERGKRKSKDKEMDFGKFSRAIRYHYSHGNFVPVRDEKLVYKFGPNVKGCRKY